MAQVMECLPSKPEAVSSNPSTIEREGEKEEGTGWQWLTPVILQLLGRQTSGGLSSKVSLGK
jgi:hypothetical protein